ncbi:uncharacterized protein B0T15DRAFT_513753 [Chaetomium strumarium]|uniref:Uncharacterized protein n=1 Tax=Chaetomium strumarium TaxID=1170767 RepID=A0AAJ0GP82_9PEZI|nr:hypothetical protein B0T15DRAFT_513753 [Chaetomium strumarium]
MAFSPGTTLVAAAAVAVIALNIITSPSTVHFSDKTLCFTAWLLAAAANPFAELAVIAGESEVCYTTATGSQTMVDESPSTEALYHAASYPRCNKTTPLICEALSCPLVYAPSLAVLVMVEMIIHLDGNVAQD